MARQKVIPVHAAPARGAPAQQKDPETVWVLRIADLDAILAGDGIEEGGRWEDRFRARIQRVPYARGRGYDGSTLSFYTWREAYVYAHAYYTASATLPMPQALSVARAAAAPYRQAYAGLSAALTERYLPSPPLFLPSPPSEEEDPSS